ncbi:MAG: hypothetical protein ACO2PN_16470 [Pyrobaculum sp.]
MFRELRLARGMPVEFGEELKTGKAALGGAQRVKRLATELRGCPERRSSRWCKPCTST